MLWVDVADKGACNGSLCHGSEVSDSAWAECAKEKAGTVLGLWITILQRPACWRFVAQTVL